MISKRKVFSFNLPWNIHHKSLQHYFKYMNKWRRSVMVINGKWWIYSKSKKTWNYVYLIFLKSLQSQGFSKCDIILKCLHLFPIHKLLISNLYIVLTKTNINLSRMTTSWWGQHLRNNAFILLYAPLLTREDSITLRRISYL